MHKKYPSTAHGAYMSGEDAASAIVGNAAANWYMSYRTHVASFIFVITYSLAMYL